MNRITLKSSILFSLLALGACRSQQPGAEVNSGAIWQSEAYAIYPDSVVQGEHVARVVSRTELITDYKSPANAFQSPRIKFKFAINGRDNEMKSGVDHHFNCLGGDCQTPVITFGQQFNDQTQIPNDVYLAPNTKMTVRLDMRPMLRAFEKEGAYTTPTGDRIYKEDFKGIYIAGGTAPLNWDFSNLGGNESFKLKDPDGDGIYEITLTLNAPGDDKSTATHWKLTKDISAFPQYTSNYPIVDALYNMALEEMQMDIEPDSTFRTGKEWAGVWTRDISYSIILGMAQLQPKVSMYSLMRKVKDGRIVQDTGTGGAYPVSTDRMVWAVAAWEVYKATGDQKWLRETYAIIKKSLEEDYKNAYNTETGMVRGESSFLDWREQTYPLWMQPADIYESENLGTNAVHYQANIAAAQMAELLNDSEGAAKFRKVAEGIKEGMNKLLWQAEKGYYGQYLYGRNYKILSLRAEALGEALSVLYGVADEARRKTVVASTPVTDYGTPSIYPQIPGIPPYHNNGIWPFVQAYWSLAAAKAGNGEALAESISAIYRPAALFLTNKENFVSSNGDYAGTQINSDRQLWSVAGNLSMVYKVFFGMDMQVDKMVLKPFVPKAFAGERKLSNVKYRNAILNLEMSGFGNEIKSITMDGKSLERAEIPGDLTGSHTIKIELANNETGGKYNHTAYYTSPDMPKVTYAAGKLTWPAVEGAVAYQVIRNGEELEKTESTSLAVEANSYAEYMVLAIDANGVTSFGSEPVVVVPDKYKLVYELEKSAPKARLPYRDFSGTGFVEISKKQNTSIKVEVAVPEDGVYAIDFRYANGNGPINTENKAAIRTLKKGSEFIGTIVLPQRGTDEWNNWGFTNAVEVSLKKGKHTLSLTFEPHNENMNGEINQAMVDYMRVVKIK
ncbi:family 78 glycoside hydrolase catalytic domain [Pontibacter korlensis]|uniref:Glycogen debranching protein n=1 Tax=Pontibacter korlensis TaxID=400092 RepID=A0A0E3UVR1_9BACT|nr:family 78 glycoside hydrolase catalytic domain [Pontibacter korlensis]AKD02081.1 glycogen debranching protein [Pontibacter korlensis]